MGDPIPYVLSSMKRLELVFVPEASVLCTWLTLQLVRRASMVNYGKKSNCSVL